MKNLIILSFCVLNCFVVLAQKKSCNSYSIDYKETDSEIIKEEIKFTNTGDDNIFMIENINGSIEVEGYGGNTIQIEVEKVIKAANKEELKKGMDAIQLGTFQNDSGVCLYTDAPFVEFDKKNMSFDYKKSNKKSSCQQGNWNNTNDQDDYQYELNYKVKVPRTVNVKIDNLSGPKIEVNNIKGEMMELKNASGHIYVNDIYVKDIEIKTMSGHIKGEKIEAKDLVANTMSGHVKLYNVKGAATEASSMSGHVMITYDENPNDDSYYSSMSGHVDIGFQPNLNAEISQVVNSSGKLYSDFTDLSNNTNTNTKSSKNKNSCSSTCTGNSKKANYKVGKGGDKFSLSTMNGHVKVRKI